MQLRPYQQAALEKFLARPDKRLIFAHATSGGKTRTALEAARRLDAKRILVVGSAQSRATWPKEAERWEFPELHSIRFGRTNKSLTKKQQVEREIAYSAPCQVVSYALMKHLEGPAPDLLIVDEAHAIKMPTSQQSRLLKDYLRAHPKLPALLLSATPAPKEIQDIWNLADSLFPGYLGEEADDGGVSWSFKKSYCLVERREWTGGSANHYYGANKEALPRLAKKLEPIMHRVSSAEVAQYTPTLNASILWVDEPKIKDAKIAEEWLESREADESTHVGLFAWTHATANILADTARARGWEVVFITGLQHPEQRAMRLEEAERMGRVCVVGTAGSLAESISLSFVKQALVFEWRATPGQALQFAGRFARADSKTQAPTYLQYVARTDDAHDAKVLRSRLDAAAGLYEQDSRAQELQELFAPRPITEDRLQKMAAAMFGETRLSLGSESEET